jgi:hypothetical protein
MKTFRLRIVVEAPPSNVDYALQRGSGSKYETEQLQRSAGADLHFELEVRCEGNDCRGPHVQGPRGERFVYLDIGTCAGQMDSEWSRRIKVPLTGLSEAIGATSLEARISGTGRDGSPSCATQRPLEGWRPRADI